MNNKATLKTVKALTSINYQFHFPIVKSYICQLNNTSMTKNLESRYKTKLLVI
jgi:hypothetical protein